MTGQETQTEQDYLIDCAVMDQHLDERELSWLPDGYVSKSIYCNPYINFIYNQYQLISRES